MPIRMMSIFQATVLGIVFNLALGYVPFRLYECGFGSDRLISIDNVYIDQYPITIPGQVRSSSGVTINRLVDGHLKLDVWVQKFFFFDYLTIPCISWVGSCTYDVCDLLDWFLSRGCPWQLVLSNFPCTCPFQNGTYTMSPHPFYIPAVQGPWAWIAFGDFRVTGQLTDTRTNTVVGCYTVEFTVQEYQPTSIWDIWK